MFEKEATKETNDEKKVTKVNVLKNTFEQMMHKTSREELEKREKEIVRNRKERKQKREQKKSERGGRRWVRWRGEGRGGCRGPGWSQAPPIISPPATYFASLFGCRLARQALKILLEIAKSANTC